MKGKVVSEYQGFWSYVHEDDAAEGGRIVRLAKDVQAQFEMLTGENISLFLDEDEIEWGDDWRARIDESLSSIAFFIPILTPRYFLSAECRRELQFFARRASKLGVKELVLPLLYVDVPELHEEDPDDDLVQLVSTFQWKDWRELRFEDLTSGSYRQAVADLARLLVSANRRAEAISQVPPDSETLVDEEEAEEEESPGLIDRMAGAEEAMPRWSETLSAITAEIQDIGTAMERATKQIKKGDAEGKGFSERAKVARILAKQLAKPTDRVRQLGNDFTSQLHEVDAGVRTMIDLAPGEVQRTPEAKEQICEFFATVRLLTDSVHEGMTSLQQMTEACSQIEDMSRDLRPPVRRLRQALTNMLEARELTAEWVALIDQTGIDCSDYEVQLPDQLN